MAKVPYEELEQDVGRLTRRYNSLFQASEAMQERTKELEALLDFYQKNNAALAQGKSVATETMANALTAHNGTLQAYIKDIHLLEDKLKESEARVVELEG
jgi:DNA repair exonuclease SbcCD ATPase subunit